MEFPFAMRLELSLKLHMIIFLMSNSVDDEWFIKFHEKTDVSST